MHFNSIKKHIVKNTTGFFKRQEPIRYEGPDSADPLSFRWYDPDRLVLGKRMEDHLRFSVCYWHSFNWPGTDAFGGQTFDRPWFGTGLDDARLKADVAFELFTLLRVPFFSFHDRDIAPEGKTLRESNRNVRAIADVFAQKMQETKVRLLWGTANLFSNRRFMGGAATNPDPEIFAYAAAQVKNALEITHELGGENYVLWGGREGYETLLNTDLKREFDQFGRFLNLVVEHKHKIGFNTRGRQKRKDAPVPENKVVSLEERAKDEQKPFLEQLLREGARKLLQAAIENEVIDYIQFHKDRRG